MLPLYVYLAYGSSPAVARELRYSVETLLPEISRDASRVAIFTDRPADYRDLGVRLIDATALLGSAFAGAYRHRIKPMILAEALRRFGRPCVLLDTDSFILPGFDAAVRAALEKGAAMNFFVRRDPYPDFGPFETDLPRLGCYRLDRRKSLMLNSGLVAARAEHAPLIEDAVELISRLWDGGLTRHDIEQFAVAEVFRVAGIPVALIEREFEHYCARWSRRYMRRQLRRRKASERVAFGKTRVRLFKAYWISRLAIRKWRRGRNGRPVSPNKQS